jgi:hypothetical protein
MRQETVFRRLEIYIAAAAIAAHAHSAEGFRQRDVRFLIDLCSNWTESVPGSVRPAISNVQVQRYLTELCAGGLAKKTSRNRLPSYRLTRLGLIELLSRIIHRREALPPDQFLFLYYFVSSYRDRILDLVRREGSFFPPSLKTEIEALLDDKALLREEIRRVEKRLKQTASRMSEGEETSRLTAKLFRSGLSQPEVVKEVERCYPYELNSQKPLSELIGELPAEIGRWELEVGSLRRAALLWQPARELTKVYLDCLRRFEASGR